MKIGDIEHGKPIPVGKGKYELLKQQAARLEKGDSFVVTLPKEDNVTKPTAIQTVLNKGRGKNKESKRFIAK